jgi:hypothetical protein
MEVIWESEFAFSGKSIAGVSSAAMNLKLTVLESGILEQVQAISHTTHNPTIV